MTDMKCPKCGGDMRVGHIWDTATPAWRLPAVWLPGVPKKRFDFWTNLDKKIGTPITAYRCYNCGYLELYAR